jgi:hypothetical protein
VAGFCRLGRDNVSIARHGILLCLAPVADLHFGDGLAYLRDLQFSQAFSGKFSFL